ncbi:survival motor neuron protein (SMN) domain-containing protein [Phthorimaea operculella]|nr:survival motor neuron protein (SMN) domain-containing protein [Phthorimaea operculella]
MPKNDVLYCKGMNMSHSESEVDISEEKWDDEQLNAAYDKALKLANVEVAKRIAMATNSSGKKNEGKDKSRKPSKKQGSKKLQWSSGMPCRAIYEEDGLEYEAFVLRILNDKECIVKFLGYDNSETVDIETMKPSLGKEAQRRQMEQAMLDQGEESDASMPPATDREMQTDRGESPESIPGKYANGIVDIETMKPSLGKEAQRRQMEQAMLDQGEESDASMPPATDREMQTDRGESPESIHIETMKPSLGKEAQRRQMEQAMLDQGEESDASMPPATDREMQTDRGESPESIRK